IFNFLEQQNLFFEKIDLNDAENRKVFFDDITHLIQSFIVKMKKNIFADISEKLQVETAYSYLIQFILFKVIVDNGLKDFTELYKNLFKLINRNLGEKREYDQILLNIKNIADFISSHIYKPFKDEQENINNKIFTNFKTGYSIDDISVWLDIIIFIDKYNFGNLKNEIFGFIYENYLKDLYADKNRGQFFTAPDVVNFMLNELGYTPQNIKNQKDKISIIDPSCGAGTFLYSAVDNIIRAFEGKKSETESKFVEDLINQNIFGLDIEEFPLYLAEMGILMKLLPLIINEKYGNPVKQKLKIFKTRDSISEFLDTGIGAANPEIDYPTLFSKKDLGYKSFMRDNKNLQKMIESMQGTNGKRMRFDYVIGNPPYIGINECSTQKVDFVEKMKDKHNFSISWENIYGINFKREKKYPPKPNLYAFFIALGLALLKDNGKMCYVIPQTLLTETDYDVLRYYLSKNTTIEKLITFKNNLFVGRGFKQKKNVATSSLIIVVKKALPTENHKVKIVNYTDKKQENQSQISENFKNQIKNEQEILQTVLFEKYLNWNFIKQNDSNFLNFSDNYNKNTISIENYRSELLKNADELILDVGFILKNENITSEMQNIEDWELLSFDKNRYIINKIYGYYPNDKSKIDLPLASYGYKTLDFPYKIVWQKSYGSKHFYYSDRRILPNMSNQQIMVSKNKNEIFYLFALLNSPVNQYLLHKLFSLGNEKIGMFIVVKRLKNFVRIPKINDKNKFVKTKIIDLAGKFIENENITLKNLVDFSGLMVQRFENVQVTGNNLILTFNQKDYQQKIAKGKADFVRKLIFEKFYDSNLIFNRQEVTLQELQNLEAIDFEEQKKLKNHIDNLVFALYFDIVLPENQLDNTVFVEQECKKNKFYELINAQKS
ncbi:MAG: SAM-dependent methyltransferase, partial [Prevotellaceae bacterium]|nr:SAM-dependent methyltransferase [Prevotellaceae bacterium]